jgi:hypothetical protein|tara:strand:+ start:2603 stop:2929 length:327 start_codon:yes stop_codon:yes gene_type:complete
LIQNKNLIYIIVLIAGFILIWKFYSEQSVRLSFNSKKEIEEEPLIIVGGKIAPKLKKNIEHMAYINEKTCLQCHVSEKKINFGSEPVIVKKMPHEYRDNCVSCHILQK